MIKEYQVAAGVMAFSTTRKGGVSQGNYGEFNINEYCGDFAEHGKLNSIGVASIII